MNIPATLLALTVSLPAAAQINTFDLVSSGKTIGHSTFTLAKSKQGFRLTGKVGYSLHGADAHTSEDVRLSDTYAFQQGSLTDDNSQSVYSFTPDKTRTILTIGTVQAGQMDSRKLTIKPDLVFLPGYDAGAAQVLLLLATTNPTPTNLYDALIPNPATGNNAYDALWTKGPDAAGTLDGKPVTLHTFVLSGGKATWTFYADDQNNLMQLDASMVQASYIRAKFKLIQTP